jgi:hypothetical protein
MSIAAAMMNRMKENTTRNPKMPTISHGLWDLGVTGSEGISTS